MEEVTRRGPARRCRADRPAVRPADRRRRLAWARRWTPGWSASSRCGNSAPSGGHSRRHDAWGHEAVGHRTGSRSLLPVIRVGLTGGIASGKSLVATELARLGAVVIDADVLAREVVEPGTPGLAAVVQRFGAEVLDGDRLDRARLGAIVFADPGPVATWSRSSSRRTRPGDGARARRAAWCGGGARDSPLGRDRPAGRLRPRGGRRCRGHPVGPAALSRRALRGGRAGPAGRSGVSGGPPGRRRCGAVEPGKCDRSPAPDPAVCGLN